MKKVVIAALLAAAAALVGTQSARADEPLFGYIVTTDVLPKGQKELEQWSTLREGRTQGDYHLWQGRTEFSYGITDSLQASAYLLYAYANVYQNTPEGETSPPEIFADYTADPDARFEKWRFEGVAGELIWRILSPYTDPVGFAIYFEPTIGPRTREMETRLILQKNFYDDRIVLAFNLTVGQELRKLQGDPTADPDSRDFRVHWDRETDINFSLAGSYRFAANWSTGVEFLNEREFASLNPFKTAVRNNVAYFVGPNIHYGGKSFFVTGTFLIQLPWAKDYANPPPGFIVHGLTNADDFEKYRLRIKVGFYF